MVLVAGSAAALVLVVSAAAAPGDLDPSFAGKDGVRTFELRGGLGPYFPGGAEDVALQPDGKILAVGDLDGGSSSSAVGVFRDTPSGGLDRSFGRAAGWRRPSGRSRTRTPLRSSGTGRSCSPVRRRVLTSPASRRPLSPKRHPRLPVRRGRRRANRPRWCGCHFRAVEVLRDGRIVAAAGCTTSSARPSRVRDTSPTAAGRHLLQRRHRVGGGRRELRGRRSARRAARREGPHRRRWRRWRPAVYGLALPAQRRLDPLVLTRWDA